MKIPKYILVIAYGVGLKLKIDSFPFYNQPDVFEYLRENEFLETEIVDIFMGNVIEIDDCWFKLIKIEGVVDEE